MISLSRVGEGRCRAHALPAWLAATVAVVVGFAPSSCRADESVDETVEVEVWGVRMDYMSRSPVVILQDKSRARSIPIWIGASEAQAIDMEMRGAPAPRPLTHDLLKTILQGIGVVFDRAVVNDLKGSTYYARLHLVSAGKPMEVDCRPSDAIALALRFERPIFVAKALLDRGPSFDARGLGGAAPSAETVQGITVQELTEDLSAYFGVTAKEGGVVVSDAGSHPGLVPGDVIVGVGEERVLDVQDFRRKMASVAAGEITLRVRRGEEEVGVKFLP